MFSGDGWVSLDDIWLFFEYFYSFKCLLISLLIYRTKDKKFCKVSDNKMLLDSHGITVYQFEEAVSSIQSFVLFENAFPFGNVQYKKILAIIARLPYKGNSRNLVFKVSIQ